MVMCAVAAAALVGGGALRAGGQDADSEPPPQRPLQYRTVYAPADREDEWRPTGKPAYFPMKPAEFHEKIAQANSLVAHPFGHEGAVIVSARYEARLEGSELVGGRAWLHIRHVGPQGASLLLGPCNLAIRQAGWADRDGETARFGLGASRRLELQVEQDGVLEFEWTLGGRSGPLGAIEFDLELPVCPASQVVLSLPRGRIPVSQTGLVFRQGPAADGVTVSGHVLASGGTLDGEMPSAGGVFGAAADAGAADFHKWQIELGGQSRFSLRVTSEEDPEGHRHLSELRETFLYQLTPGGLELNAVLRFDVLGQPLRRFEFALDPRLELISVRDGGSAVPWDIASSPSGESLKRVVVELPSPLRGLGRELTLTALAPVRVGEKWRLPRIHCDGVFWRGAAVSLAVERPLSVEDILPDRARISGFRSGADPVGAETIDLQYFSKDAGVDVVLRQSRRFPRADVGVALELSGGQIAGRQTALLQISDGECFLIEGTVASSWIIDSVQAEPADSLRDWRTEPAGGGRRNLRIDLAKPLSPARPIRISISARRLQSPVGRKQPVHDAIPVRLTPGAEGRALIALRGAESTYQIQLTGDEAIQRRDVQALSPEELRLFAEAPRGTLFVYDLADRNVAFSLQRKRSRFSADVHVVASVSGDMMTEAYSFQIDPELGRLERLAVEFLERPGVPVRWSPATGDETRLIQGLAPAPGEGKPSGNGRLERWEVRLRPSRSEPFELRASRTFKLDGPVPVGLARLPEAAEQRGLLAVDSSGQTLLRIVNRGLTRVFPEASQAGPPKLPRATYHFDPRRDLGGTPPITVGRSEPGSPQPKTVWVWECRLESRFQPDGTGRHLAIYRLENAGSPLLRLSLPPSIDTHQVESVTIDGERASWQALSEDGGQVLALRLDPRLRFQAVTVSFRTRATSWSVVERLEALVPEPQTSVLQRHWLVWLPPGWQSLRSATAGRGSHAADDWTVRLLGPMARAAGFPPFDPADVGTWRLADRSNRSGDSAAKQAHRLLEVFAQTIAEREHQPGFLLDWGGLLTHPAVGRVLEDPSEQRKGVLLVDWKALQQEGVSPRMKVVLPGGNDLADQATALLQSAGLAIAVADRGMLITTAEKVASEHAGMARIRGNVLWWANSEAWHEESLQALPGGQAPRLISAGEWSGLPEAVATPWSKSPRTGYEAKDTVGWTVTFVDLKSGRSGGLVAVDRTLLLSAIWLTFLCAAALNWALAVRRPAACILSVVLVAVAAVYGADFLSPWLPAVFWGSLTGLGLRLLSARRERRARRVVATRRVADSEVLPGAVVGLLLALVWAATGEAQDPAAEDHRQSTPLVYVPVDANGEPTGGEYYVPESFYNELWKRASLVGQKPRGWLLNAATYQGRLAWPTTSERLVLSEFKAVFDIEVIGALQRVAIPLGDTLDHWNLDQARLDGRQIEPAWEEDGTLVFYAEQTPWCRLELSLRPLPNYGADPAGFELAIPPLPTSRLELSIPPDAPVISVPTALGSVSLQRDHSLLTAELGPADRLTVQWEDKGRALAGRSTLVEEFLWLRVELGYAMLEAQVRYQLAPDFDGNVTLLHDLRLIPQGPFEVEGAVLAAVESDKEGSLMRQTLRLNDIESSAVTIRGRFLLAETSGVGQLRLPSFRSADFGTSRRWAAVSIASSLLFEYQTLDRVSLLGLNEFAGAWAEGTEPPTLAFQMDAPQSSITLTTQPREPRSSASWQLGAGYHLEKTRVRFLATVDTREGYLFQHRLTVPANLQVEEITATVGDAPRGLRWTQPGETQVIVFFDAPLSGQHALFLEGTISPGGERTGPLPMLRLDGVADESGTVELYRRPEVCVELGPVEGMTEIVVPAGTALDPDLGRLRSRWVTNGTGQAAMTVQVRENRPKVSVEQDTSLWYRPSGWTATVEWRLKVEGGVLDQFRVAAPASWRGPFELDPKLSIETVDAERGTILFRPRTPIEGETSLRISGPIQQGSGLPPAVPAIHLVDIPIDRRMVILPTGPDSSIRWQTRGLVAAAVPSRFPFQTPGAGWMAYEVERDDFSAVLRPIADSPRVYLADVRLSWTETAACHGVAVFDLKAGELESCLLRLPDGLQVVAVSNAGVPTYYEVDTENSWRVSLGRTVLPQRLEVVFAGQLPVEADGQTGRITEIVLEELPTVRSVWTITGPVGHQVTGVSENQVIPLHELAMERLRNVTAIMEVAGEDTGASPDESRAWYRGWLENWAQARSAAEKALALTARTMPVRALLAELETLDLEQKERLDSQNDSALWEGLLAETGNHHSAGAVWDWAKVEQEQVHLDFEGEFPALTLRAGKSAAADPRSMWLWPTVVLSGIVLGLGLVIGTGRLYRWPHTAAVAFGLIWWLWLWPSFAGLLIVGVSLWASLRLGWRRSRGGQTAIVRLSHANR